MISEPIPEKSEPLNFQSVADRVPPQNLEAEEAILGGILVDTEAIGRITDILEGDAFYLAAHRLIYEAALTLHQSGKPADLMTVATWLGDRGTLDKVGGQSRLVELYDRTPGAVNIDLYAQLVMDKYLRRRLIRVGNEISDLGHDTAQELPEVLDSAEQKVFNITQARPQDGLVSTAEVLTQTFADIESRAIGQTLPGLACGFYDLDAMTQGFQRGDLIIVAGRPSMGKTSVVLNIARNVASYHKLPVAVFSLEMSRDQLVQRLLSSEVRIESSRLRAGRISAQEWEPLAHEISKLSQLPLYIDDTPNLTVTEMRSRCRRLQAESGGALGLVVIDYLQLMGGNSENRVQMLSQITRGLKGLARELAVPVIALSQLSRGVESRTDKRPMMSDLRECVTGDTLVMLADGRRVPIASLVGTTPEVLTMTVDEKISIAKSDCVWSVGNKSVFQVNLASGRAIKATAQHRIYSGNGWQQLDALKIGDRIAIARTLPEPREPSKMRDSDLELLGHLIGDGSFIKGQPLRYTTASEDNSRIVTQAAEALGSTVKRYKGRGNWHQLLISGNGDRWHPKGVNLWLRNLGIFNQRSHQKHIPDDIFQLSNEKIAIVLKHLWATDGCYYTPKSSRTSSRITFATNSDRLSKDVMAMLSRFGIIARIRVVQQKQYRSMYVVEISGKKMQMKFLRSVSAAECKQEAALNVENYLKNLKENPNRDTLPQQIFATVQTQMKEKGISQRKMATLRGTSYGGSSHFKFAPSRSTLLNYAEILNSSDLMEKATSDLFWDEIVSITPIGEAEVFDLTVPGTASWLADGIVSHNSGAIEQDADLIMMLYRDEYYNKDTVDRGIAELIINKHRNGPTGTVKLLFEPQYTQFRNLSASNQ
jgi:replicative DNA helicase